MTIGKWKISQVVSLVNTLPDLCLGNLEKQSQLSKIRVQLADGAFAEPAGKSELLIVRHIEEIANRVSRTRSLSLNG